MKDYTRGLYLIIALFIAYFMYFNHCFNALILHISCKLSTTGNLDGLVLLEIINKNNIITKNIFQVHLVTYIQVPSSTSYLFCIYNFTCMLLLLL